MKNKLLSLSLALVMLPACSTGLEPVSQDPYLPTDYQMGNELMVLGRKLQDPYTVENMNQALTKLYPGTKASRAGVAATDLYVRMLPESQLDFDLLEDMGVVMMDHPFDYEIVRDGDWYHDPDIPDEDITWQYAVVSPDFICPRHIRYEVLDSCFISEHVQSTKAMEGIDWDAVERESFILTGNSDLLKGRTKAESICPRGRICIIDERFPWEETGVAGVTVVANVFVKIATAYTDSEGNYEMKTGFGTDVRYRLMFRNRKGFALGMNLILVPASLSALGKGGPEGMDVVIDSESDRKLFSRAVVNNAGWDYFEKCSQGDETMSTPPANLRLWLFQSLEHSLPVMLQQGALVDNSVLGDYLEGYMFLVKMLLPDVILGVKGADDYASIYARALHQFAHGSHFCLVGTDYWDHLLRYDIETYIASGGVHYGAGTETNHGYCEVAEMWAYYMQTMMYNDRYPDEPMTFGMTHWFYPQILMFLDERGLGRFEIIRGLTSDVTDRQTLQNRLLCLYPEMRDEINQAFTRYL